MKSEEIIATLKKEKKNLISNDKCKDCAFQNVDCYYFDRNCWANHTNLHSNTTLNIESGD